MATSCDYDRFADLRRRDRPAYHREKKRIRDTILELLQAELWLVNATAGFPSVAGTIGAGLRLFDELSA